MNDLTGIHHPFQQNQKSHILDLWLKIHTIRCGLIPIWEAYFYLTNMNVEISCHGNRDIFALSSTMINQNGRAVIIWTWHTITWWYLSRTWFQRCWLKNSVLIGNFVKAWRSVLKSWRKQIDGTFYLNHKRHKTPPQHKIQTKYMSIIVNTIEKKICQLTVFNAAKFAWIYMIHKSFVDINFGIWSMVPNINI